jgi:putative ABC transport system permease protein
VSTLVGVISIIRGMDIYIADRVANMGANVFLVRQMGFITNAKDFMEALRKNRRINWEDYVFLRDNMKLAQAVGVEVRRNGKSRYGGETLDDINVRGVTPNIGQMDVQEVERGRYITEGDEERRTPVVVIGADLAKRFFPTVDPLAKTIYIDGRPYQIVGVGKEIGSVFGQSQDSYVYLPISTYLKVYGTAQSLSINVQSRGPEWVARTQEEARVLMRAKRHLGPKDEDTFGVIAADNFMDLWKRLTGTIAASAVGIVSVFLVIGGIVIMNVMLASVTERTREIGIRKALGAKQRDILLQFIVESGVMSGVGGALGILLAYTVSTLVKMATPVPSVVPLSAVILALGVSTAVGLFFGIYPARKAARLDPIEALRYEV